MPPRSAPLPGPVLVTKNVMFGDCGGCGGDGCCAPAPEAATNTNTATTDGFSFFIVVSSYKSSYPMTRPEHLNPERPDPFHRRGKRIAAELRAHCGDPQKSGCPTVYSGRALS